MESHQVIELKILSFEGKRTNMSEDNKKKKDEELNITDEDNVEEQFEFGLNEDKREEVEEDGHTLPEDQNEISTDAENVDYEENKD